MNKIGECPVNCEQKIRAIRSVSSDSELHTRVLVPWTIKLDVKWVKICLVVIEGNL